MKKTTRKVIEFETLSAIGVCEARIENGAKITEAFKWLREELNDMFNNGSTYYLDEAVANGNSIRDLLK